MRIKKYKAFTLAELMVLLAFGAILMAAFAPAITVRYNNASKEDVWSFILDEGMNAYSAAPAGKAGRFFVGTTPDNQTVKTYTPESKLIIQSANDKSNQPQISFRYGNDSNGIGTRTADLLATPSSTGNMLLGGPFNSISSSAKYNTAFGVNALKKLTKGRYNTAIGYKSLSELTTADYNTAIGSNAGEKITIGTGNTFIGYQAGANVTTGYYNTIVGNYAGNEIQGHANTLLGEYAGYNISGTSSNNTAIGYKAFSSSEAGSAKSHNTAVGTYALSDVGAGASFNTAIGYNACSYSGLGSHKVCIGANSGSGNKDDYSSNINTLLKDNYERIFIGSKPKNLSGVAVLEIHNVNGTHKYLDRNGTYDYNDIGNASVIVNGNLVVRGQSYFLAPPMLPKNGDGDSYNSGLKGLVAFKFGNHRHAGTYKLLQAFDGEGTTYQLNGSYNKRHKTWHGRESCVCSVGSVGDNGIRSYDWFSPINLLFSDPDHGEAYYYYGRPYKDYSFDGYLSVDNDSYGQDHEDNVDFNHGGADLNRAHNYKHNYFLTKDSDEKVLKYSAPATCCPVLTDSLYIDTDGSDTNKNKYVRGEKGPFVTKYGTLPESSSDLRLKNIVSEFKQGLESIKKIKIYNYTFKKDKSKNAQVGVIAQDLKKIFPTAVWKDENGYYRIRWDEMFFASINAVKELSDKVDSLIARVDNDLKRISQLKKDNAQLKQKLNKLEVELIKLEK